jgi:hypothetical protein
MAIRKSIFFLVVVPLVEAPGRLDRILPAEQPHQGAVRPGDR